MNQKRIKSESLFISKNLLSQTLSLDTLSEEERKSLIDSLVDPVFVISNANSLLKDKLEKFVDSETRDNFYMIDRSQKKLVNSINQLRQSKNPM